jgi:hypothetical protein
MTKSLIIQIAFFMLLGCYQPLSAVEIKPGSLNNKPPQDRMEKQSAVNITANSGFQKGASFQSDRETYVFLPELYSVAKKKQATTRTNTLGKPNLIQEEKASDLVGEKGRFSIYKSGNEAGPSSVTVRTRQSRTLFPVVLNLRTNNLAIVTGTIKVELEDIDQAESIAADLGLIVRRKFGHLRTVYFSVAEGQDILSKNDTLKGDTRVKKAVIEVLENIMIPQ